MAMPEPAVKPLIDVDEAMQFVLDRARPLPATEVVVVPVEAALGRVLAEAVTSPIDVPGYDNSAMDGYAVRAADLADDPARPLRVSQRIAAGQVGQPVPPGEAARIFTGAPLPGGADAIAIQEDCEVDGETITVRETIAAGDWVRPRGNDISAGSVILEPGTRLRPQELGLAASVGVGELSVTRKLRVAIFASGDELRQPGEPLPAGAIYNSNRYSLHGLLQGLGCEVVDHGTVEDTLEATRAILARAAASADVVVSTGGMSVGEEDHIKTALEEVGNLEMWKVAVKPGKPLAYGRIGDADFLGLPGNPVSTLVTFCLFVRPFLLSRLGVTQVTPAWFEVPAGFDWPKPVRRREFVRARLCPGADGGQVAELFARQGSDVLTSTVWASGLLEILEGRTYAKGDRLRYFPFSELLN